ncbi:MAG: hypothetical protein HW384_1318, partial [Dehalococcoidia bacterium]|nr:hypothetical protein [Dehalococcoidia bacterium]
MLEEQSDEESQGGVGFTLTLILSPRGRGGLKRPIIGENTP